MRDYLNRSITRNLAGVIVNVLDADFKKSQPKKDKI